MVACSVERFRSGKLNAAVSTLSFGSEPTCGDVGGTSYVVIGCEPCGARQSGGVMALVTQPPYQTCGTTGLPVCH